MSMVVVPAEQMSLFGAGSEDSPVAASLYLSLTLPGEIGVEAMQSDTALQRLQEMLAGAAQDTWEQELSTGGPDYWAPLAPATIAAKAKAGMAHPSDPLRGAGELENQLKAQRPVLSMAKDDHGTTLTITWNAWGNDMSPSEKYSDLFGGSPGDVPEAMAYGTRGVIPARPLGIDARVGKGLGTALRAWGSMMTTDDQTQLCFNEQVGSLFSLGSGDGITQLPPNTSTRDAQYLLEG